MSFASEFREFAVKGGVVDLAVGSSAEIDRSK
jgi:large-conductance mechanosensitive channel